MPKSTTELSVTDVRMFGLTDEPARNVKKLRFKNEY